MLLLAIAARIAVAIWVVARATVRAIEHMRESNVLMVSIPLSV